MSTEKDVKDTIVGWLGDKKANNEDRNSVVKVIVGLLLAAFAFFVLSYLSWKKFHQWQDLSRLKHARDVLEQEKIRAKVEKQIAELDHEGFALTKEIAALDKEIAVLGKDIATRESEYNLEREKVNAIENWEDIINFARSSGLQP